MNRTFFVPSALLLSLCAAAHGATASFQQDTQGYTGAQDVNLSTQNSHYSGGVGNTSRDGDSLGCYRISGAEGYENRILVRFTGLALPPGARVTGATLTLTFDNWARGFAVRGYYLKQPWSYSARRLGWQQRDDGHAWIAPGALGPEASAPAFALQEFAGRGDEAHSVPLDPQVVAGWLQRPATNNGLLLVNDTPDRVTRVYASEHKDPGRRPRLSISYELPGGTPGAAAVAQGAPRESPAAPPVVSSRRSRPRLLLTSNVLPRLQARAQAGDQAWRALADRCDGFLPGQVEWPDGNDYPNAGSIGEGYQGSDYFDALLSLALCYQATPDSGRARRYGEKGVEVLMKMSEPAGPHSVNPLRDSGYGIRFFGLGMALGYDWLRDALSATQKGRLLAALDRWIDTYEEKGFGREHPQGNYFAGYYATKALAGLGTRGESPRGEAHWQDFLRRVHLGMVQPYYAAHMRGGGWPEGWNYGPLATLNMSWPALVASAELVRDARAPFLFPIEQGAQLLHFTWPSRRTLDDRHVQYDGDNPSGAQPALFTTQAGILRLLGDSLAPVFQRFARAVRTAQPGAMQAWVEFLFWDDSAPERDFQSLPRSYLSRGMNTVAMRSSWETDAVWASFTAGPYVNYPGSGEQYFDQGSLAVVRGGKPLLVNAPAALLRHRPGTEDGRGYDDLIYNEIFQGGSRRLFNVFYVDQPRPFGQLAAIPEEARTRIGAFEDGGDYVLMRGDHLEDMYRKGKRGLRFVLSWTRSVLYLRPGLFLIHDDTDVSDGALDQWMAFHLPERPAGPGARLDVGAGPGFRGTITPLLPIGARRTIVDLFQRGKVFRLEVRPAAASTSQRWLTAIEATGSPADATAMVPLSTADGNVLSGLAAGALLRGGGGRLVLFRKDGPGELRYRVPGPASFHLIAGLARDRDYTVQVSEKSGAQEVRISEGAGLRSTTAGVLSFLVKGGAARATRK